MRGSARGTGRATSRECTTVRGSCDTRSSSPTGVVSGCPTDYCIATVSVGPEAAVSRDGIRRVPRAAACDDSPDSSRSVVLSTTCRHGRLRESWGLGGCICR